MDAKGAKTTEAEVRDALKGVVDPDHGRDIVTLGRISGLVVRNGNVGFAIEVEPERGPQLEPLRKAAEDAVMRLPGVVSVTAVLTAERAGSPTPAERAAPGTPVPSADVRGARHQAQAPHEIGRASCRERV